MPTTRAATPIDEIEAVSERPLTTADLARMPRVPRVAIIRRTLGLTQEDFAARYRIPLGTLRDWEQGRSTPDGPARAYLTVIAKEPVMVAGVLRSKYEEKSAELDIGQSNR